MKQILLVAAIYSLIIHQSQKQAKQKRLPAVKKTITKTAIPVTPRQQQIALRNMSYENFGLISGNAQTKWSEKE